MTINRTGQHRTALDADRRLHRARSDWLFRFDDCYELN